jgi:hypothetical protein
LTRSGVELTHGKQTHGQLPGGGQPVGGQSLPGGGVIGTSMVGGGFVGTGGFVGGGPFGGVPGPSQSGHSALQKSWLNGKHVNSRVFPKIFKRNTSRLDLQAELGIHGPIPMDARNGFRRQPMRTRFRKRMVFSVQQVVQLGHQQRTANCKSQSSVK